MSTYAQLRLAAEVYAVPIGNVVEIASLGELTADVPGIFSSLQPAEA
jgi:chemotaxis signal transduction protein